MKRQRGRGRKPGNPSNRSYESNGPEVKIRGNASQIYDKYLQLARDASSAGDRVRAENLYQHAEHYLRIVQVNQPKRDPNADDNSDNDDSDNPEGSNDDNDGDNGQGHNRDRDNRDSRDNREPRRSRSRQRSSGRDRSGSDKDNESSDPLGVVTPEGDQGQRDTSDGDAKGSKSSDDGEDGESPRRRTRRPRRTKAEIEADKAAASDALDKASASADNAGGDDPESQAA